MGFSFRKSIKLGPARVNLSKSGVGSSVGAGGLRYTKSPKRKTKSSKQSSGGSKLGKIAGYALLFLAVLGLAVSYWQWTLAILAIGFAGAIGYWIFKKKKTQAEVFSGPETEEENNPVP